MMGQLRLKNESAVPLDITLTADGSVEVLRPGDEVVMDLDPGQESDPIRIGCSKERVPG